ncbi:hypothetical protein HMI55_005161 [Coelomomyces lativittatus]|nr:hypothetical protein HMI55_005161 [Coelomomyces lativittatus]
MFVCLFIYLLPNSSIRQLDAILKLIHSTFPSLSPPWNTCSWHAKIGSWMNSIFSSPFLTELFLSQHSFLFETLEFPIEVIQLCWAQFQIALTKMQKQYASHLLQCLFLLKPSIEKENVEWALKHLFLKFPWVWISTPMLLSMLQDHRLSLVLKAWILDFHLFACVVQAPSSPLPQDALVFFSETLSLLAQTTRHPCFHSKLLLRYQIYAGFHTPPSLWVSHLPTLLTHADEVSSSSSSLHVLEKNAISLFLGLLLTTPTSLAPPVDFSLSSLHAWLRSFASPLSTLTLSSPVFPHEFVLALLPLVSKDRTLLDLDLALLVFPWVATSFTMTQRFVNAIFQCSSTPDPGSPGITVASSWPTLSPEFFDIYYFLMLILLLKTQRQQPPTFRHREVWNQFLQGQVPYACLQELRGLSILPMVHQVLSTHFDFPSLTKYFHPPKTSSINTGYFDKLNFQVHFSLPPPSIEKNSGSPMFPDSPLLSKSPPPPPPPPPSRYDRWQKTLKHLNEQSQSFPPLATPSTTVASNCPWLGLQFSHLDISKTKMPTSEPPTLASTKELKKKHPVALETNVTGSKNNPPGPPSPSLLPSHVPAVPKNAVFPIMDPPHSTPSSFQPLSVHAPIPTSPPLLSNPTVLVPPSQPSVLKKTDHLFTHFQPELGSLKTTTERISGFQSPGFPFPTLPTTPPRSSSTSVPTTAPTATATPTATFTSMGTLRSASTPSLPPPFPVSSFEKIPEAVTSKSDVPLVLSKHTPFNHVSPSSMATPIDLFSTPKSTRGSSDSPPLHPTPLPSPSLNETHNGGSPSLPSIPTYDVHAHTESIALKTNGLHGPFLMHTKSKETSVTRSMVPEPLMAPSHPPSFPWPLDIKKEAPAFVMGTVSKLESPFTSSINSPSSLLKPFIEKKTPEIHTHGIKGVQTMDSLLPCEVQPNGHFTHPLPVPVLAVVTHPSVPSPPPLHHEVKADSNFNEPFPPSMLLGVASTAPERVPNALHPPYLKEDPVVETGSSFMSSSFLPPRVVTKASPPLSSSSTSFSSLPSPNRPSNLDSPTQHGLGPLNGFLSLSNEEPSKHQGVCSSMSPSPSFTRSSVHPTDKLDHGQPYGGRGPENSTPLSPMEDPLSTSSVSVTSLRSISTSLTTAPSPIPTTTTTETSETPSLITVDRTETMDWKKETSKTLETPGLLTAHRTETMDLKKETSKTLETPTPPSLSKDHSTPMGPLVTHAPHLTTCDCSSTFTCTLDVSMFTLPTMHARPFSRVSPGIPPAPVPCDWTSSFIGPSKYPSDLEHDAPRTPLSTITTTPTTPTTSSSQGSCRSSPMDAVTLPPSPRSFTLAWSTSFKSLDASLFTEANVVKRPRKETQEGLVVEARMPRNEDQEREEEEEEEEEEDDERDGQVSSVFCYQSYPLGWGFLPPTNASHAFLTNGS